MTLDPQNPKPGLYESVPWDTYRATSAVNHSLLEKGLLSPAHMKAAIDDPDDRDTDATNFGTAVHAAILEPDRFKSIVAPAPVNKKTGNAYGRDTQAWSEHAAGFPTGTIILSENERHDVEAMVAKVRAHPQAGKLIAAPGPREVVAIWIDEETGLVCKGRLDEHIPRIVSLDYKTTICAAPDQFGRDAAKYGYHRAVPFYIDGFKAASKTDTDYILVVQEKNPPYEVMVYRLDDAAVEAGRTQNRRLLREYAKAKATGVWPGYPAGVHTLELPKWATLMDPRGLIGRDEEQDHPF